MGYDIYAHVEVSVGGEWLHFDAPDIARNYFLFGKMAGAICYDEDPIAKEKGLPKDISKITKKEKERIDADSLFPSWLNKNEMEELKQWMDAKYGRNTYTETFGSYPKEYDNYRIVFWFVF